MVRSNASGRRGQSKRADKSVLLPAWSDDEYRQTQAVAKTSLLRMIAGHEEITVGDVILDNKNISNIPPAKRSTSMMFQNYALFPHLKVIDNIAFALKLSGIGKAERHERAMEMIESVQLKNMADRYPNQLSGGQQQRVALARPTSIDYKNTKNYFCLMNHYQLLIHFYASKCVLN